ncbi:peptide deformylase [Leuconostoc rapi]|uniref:peptide deformylase n=1 Tax=Leuconostoc rapi TaxID=1406906 RepID=UPI0019569753|nr:peptide deformylase [Leuconostoc rapi]MBM7435654.1 peptide deformylase [Leuconostoc rapi]
MTIRFTMDKITRDGNPVLRQIAQPVPFPLSEEHAQLAKDMMTYLVISQDATQNESYDLRPGVGLAAPQVGYSLQIAAVLVPSLDPHESDDEPYFKGTIFNPTIISESVKRGALDVGEGCLSVDEDVPGFVPRANHVTVRYQDEQGTVKTIKLRDYPAIVFQHEIDHLHGHLYYDHIDLKAPWQVDDDTKYIE